MSAIALPRPLEAHLVDSTRPLETGFVTAVLVRTLAIVPVLFLLLFIVVVVMVVVVVVRMFVVVLVDVLRLVVAVTVMV